MTRKKIQDKLDEIGYVGKQEKQSLITRQSQIKRTGEAIRAHRSATAAIKAKHTAESHKKTA